MRVHDGAAEIIAQGSEEYIDCQSNMFSTYALAYVDAADPYIPPSPPTPATVTIPVSGDAASVDLTVQVLGTTATVTGADVDANGTITAVGEGSTILYAYAQNGLYKTVTVTVTPGQVVPNTVEEPETEEDALQIDSLTVPDVDGGEIVLTTQSWRTKSSTPRKSKLTSFPRMTRRLSTDQQDRHTGETQCLPGMFSIE